MDRDLYRRQFNLNDNEIELISTLRPKQQLLIKTPELAKVANLEVDAKSYWLYTNDPLAKAERALEPRPLRNGDKRETLTQSERDWAYAKRALARGDDPEEIMRRIIQYRAGEKHDPEYYARHTVAKAQAALLRSGIVQSENISPDEPDRT